MLEFESFVPDAAEDGAPVLVLLHGRGADRHDLVPLRSRLPEEAVLILPQAPFEAAQWGYGPGAAWYRFLGGARPEPETFRDSQRALGEFLDTLPAELPVTPGPLIVGGFSQGGTMSIAHALVHPDRLRLVLNFSGFLAEHPDVDPEGGTAPGLDLFWGHGTSDPNIPFALAERGRQALREAGAQVEAKDYPIGHWIAPDELEDAVAWIRAAVGRSAGSGGG